MMCKKFGFAVVIATMSQGLLAGPGPGIPFAGPPPRPTHVNACYAHNRDGVSCAQVGLNEGQVGYPWGKEAGQFRCVNSCLEYVGPN